MDAIIPAEKHFDFYAMEKQRRTSWKTRFMNRIQLSGKPVPYTRFQRKAVSEMEGSDDFYEQD